MAINYNPPYNTIQVTLCTINQDTCYDFCFLNSNLETVMNKNSDLYGFIEEDIQEICSEIYNDLCKENPGEYKWTLDINIQYYSENMDIKYDYRIVNQEPCNYLVEQYLRDKLWYPEENVFEFTHLPLDIIRSAIKPPYKFIPGELLAKMELPAAHPYQAIDIELIAREYVTEENKVYYDYYCCSKQNGTWKSVDEIPFGLIKPEDMTSIDQLKRDMLTQLVVFCKERNIPLLEEYFVYDKQEYAYYEV